MFGNHREACSNFQARFLLKAGSRGLPAKTSCCVLVKGRKSSSDHLIQIGIIWGWTLRFLKPALYRKLVWSCGVVGKVNQSMSNTSLQTGDLPIGKNTGMPEPIANYDPFGSYVFQLSTSTSISQWVKWCFCWGVMMETWKFEVFAYRNVLLLGQKFSGFHWSSLCMLSLGSFNPPLTSKGDFQHHPRVPRMGQQCNLLGTRTKLLELHTGTFILVLLGVRCFWIEVGFLLLWWVFSCISFCVCLCA